MKKSDIWFYIVTVVLAAILACVFFASQNSSPLITSDTLWKIPLYLLACVASSFLFFFSTIIMNFILFVGFYKEIDKEDRANDKTVWSKSFFDTYDTTKANLWYVSQIVTFLILVIAIRFEHVFMI